MSAQTSTPLPLPLPLPPAAARNAKEENKVKANTAAVAGEARKEVVDKAAKAAATAAPPRKEQVVEEEAKEETLTMITRRPTGKVDFTWRSKMEDAGSRKGQSSKDSSRKKGKAKWDD